MREGKRVQVGDAIAESTGSGDREKELCKEVEVENCDLVPEVISRKNPRHASGDVQFSSGSSTFPV